MRSKDDNIRIFGISGFVLMACLFFYFRYSATRDYKREFKIFNSSKLAGKITYASAGSSGERIRLDNDKRLFHFITILTASNDYSQLTSIADKGDSVYKPAFSDVIYLKKITTGALYKFAFRKPEDK